MDKELRRNRNALSKVAAKEANPKWEQMISRQSKLYDRENEMRSDFYRDYTRILHSLAYRRLKHKTQVFFAPLNDHICTRMEHVNHVESVSYTIANFLGLNTELTRAISAGHDLGHAPFGHLGEKILNEFAKEIGVEFWHERNGLRFVDDLELLEDPEGYRTNLTLTYAVRDGIISHCGEVDQNGLKPREDYIELDSFREPNQYSPFTWEGCIVKLADKISYLGRDIDDVLMLKLISIKDLYGLMKFISKVLSIKIREINTTNLMHVFTADLCKNSSPKKGICLSDKVFDLMKAVKTFNYEEIYEHERLGNYKDYAKLILRKLYDVLCDQYGGLSTDEKLGSFEGKYPRIISMFYDWIKNYWDLTDRTQNELKLKNKIVYRMENGLKEYQLAVLDYLAGMTDQYAIRMHNELVTFN